MAEEELSNGTFEGYPYDVTLSYAIEDYQYAHSLAQELRELGIEVYNDEYQQPLKERACLYAHLTDLFENKAPYRVVLLSRHYVSQADLDQEIAHTLVLGKDSSTISIRWTMLIFLVFPAPFLALMVVIESKWINGVEGLFKQRVKVLLGILLVKNH